MKKTTEKLSHKLISTPARLKKLVHESTEEAETRRKGSHRNRKPKPEPTERRGGKAKKAKKAKTRTWSDVVQGLKSEDELVIARPNGQ